MKPEGVVSSPSEAGLRSFSTASFNFGDSDFSRTEASERAINGMNGACCAMAYHHFKSAAQKLYGLEDSPVDNLG